MADGSNRQKVKNVQAEKLGTIPGTTVQTGLTDSWRKDDAPVEKIQA